jgi:hypothetical protein
MQKRPELERSVETHVSGFEPPEEPIRDAGRRQIRARIADHQAAAGNEDLAISRTAFDGSG